MTISVHLTLPENSQSIQVSCGSIKSGEAIKEEKALFCTSALVAAAAVAMSQIDEAVVSELNPNRQIIALQAEKPIEERHTPADFDSKTDIQSSEQEQLTERATTASLDTTKSPAQSVNLSDQYDEPMRDIKEELNRQPQNAHIAELKEQDITTIAQSNHNKAYPGERPPTPPRTTDANDTDLNATEGSVDELSNDTEKEICVQKWSPGDSYDHSKDLITPSMSDKKSACDSNISCDNGKTSAFSEPLAALSSLKSAPASSESSGPMLQSRLHESQSTLSTEAGIKRPQRSNTSMNVGSISLLAEVATSPGNAPITIYIIVPHWSVNIARRYPSSLLNLISRTKLTY